MNTDTSNQESAGATEMVVLNAETEASQLPVVAKANTDNWKDVWPSHTTTWLRYFYIGRWNYVKGLLVASAIALGVGYAFGANVGWIVMAAAVSYVAVSCFGLYLLYGNPSLAIFERLFAMAHLQGNERVLDIHFGTYRASRLAIELLPQSHITAIGIHDPEHETEPAVLDVWEFEHPPLGHPQFEAHDGGPDQLPVPDNSQDVVLLGFGIHEVHSDSEREQMMGEIKRFWLPMAKSFCSKGDGVRYCYSYSDHCSCTSRPPRNGKRGCQATSVEFSEDQNSEWWISLSGVNKGPLQRESIGQEVAA